MRILPAICTWPAVSRRQFAPGADLGHKILQKRVEFCQTSAYKRRLLACGKSALLGFTVEGDTSMGAEYVGTGLYRRAGSGAQPNLVVSAKVSFAGECSGDPAVN
ncbi:hypothetical protein RSOLAG1IB_10052 [Rhizoctonia solani AG-1 IB]|uniref:Uncharacterized protein n=1 Tax=Thanatephorus cucumeris (strain AG1-IB / isolate 7/3/14) TaxID=1108050 RepID=A0A0B7FUS6_THACB|nr:hypothetical protein RSOLAG1IB_10052 [Rhizoctonia solani AG-1 IB]